MKVLENKRLTQLAQLTRRITKVKDVDLKELSLMEINELRGSYLQR